MELAGRDWKIGAVRALLHYQLCLDYQFIFKQCHGVCGAGSLQAGLHQRYGRQYRKEHTDPCRRNTERFFQLWLLCWFPASHYLGGGTLCCLYLTGLQYLNFICDIYSVSKEKRQQKIPALSKKLGMYEKLNDLISSYSHGMKQKVSLIGAFIHEPKLLILDEPFVALDPEAFIQLKELMKELCASGGSVLFSSHILDVVEKTCNKIAIIRNGELIRSGETKEILGNRDLENVFMELNGK